MNSVLYEVFPMSFLMEQAGGQAFTGKKRVSYPLILEMQSLMWFCDMAWQKFDGFVGYGLRVK